MKSGATISILIAAAAVVYVSMPSRREPECVMDHTLDMTIVSISICKVYQEVPFWPQNGPAAWVRCALKRAWQFIKVGNPGHNSKICIKLAHVKLIY